MINLKNRKGVDVSSNNGKINIEKIKDAGYDFVMIRAGFGEDIAEQDDTYWEENVRKCKAAVENFEKIKNNFTGKSTEKSDSNKIAKG